MNYMLFSKNSFKNVFYKMLINVILSENTNTTNDECQCKLSLPLINIYLQFVSFLRRRAAAATSKL